jgi:hypothetical protein
LKYTISAHADYRRGSKRIPYLFEPVFKRLNTTIAYGLPMVKPGILEQFSRLSRSNAETLLYKKLL